jgi:hypothetical protein
VIVTCAPSSAKPRATASPMPFRPTGDEHVGPCEVESARRSRGGA